MKFSGKNLLVKGKFMHMWNFYYVSNSRYVSSKVRKVWSKMKTHYFRLSDPLKLSISLHVSVTTFGPPCASRIKLTKRSSNSPPLLTTPTTPEDLSSYHSADSRPWPPLVGFPTYPLSALIVDSHPLPLFPYISLTFWSRTAGKACTCYPLVGRQDQPLLEI